MSSVFLNCSPTIFWGMGFITEAGTCCPVGSEGSSCLHLPRTQILGTYYHVWPSYNAGDQTQVHMPT